MCRLEFEGSSTQKIEWEKEIGKAVVMLLQISLTEMIIAHKLQHLDLKSTA